MVHEPCKWSFALCLSQGKGPLHRIVWWYCLLLLIPTAVSMNSSQGREELSAYREWPRALGTVACQRCSSMLRSCRAFLAMLLERGTASEVVETWTTSIRLDSGH